MCDFIFFFFNCRWILSDVTVRHDVVAPSSKAELESGGAGLLGISSGLGGGQSGGMNPLLHDLGESFKSSLADGFGFGECAPASDTRAAQAGAAPGAIGDSGNPDEEFDIWGHVGGFWGASKSTMSFASNSVQQQPWFPLGPSGASIAGDDTTTLEGDASTGVSIWRARGVSGVQLSEGGEDQVLSDDGEDDEDDDDGDGDGDGYVSSSDFGSATGSETAVRTVAHDADSTDILPSSVVGEERDDGELAGGDGGSRPRLSPAKISRRRNLGMMGQRREKCLGFFGAPKRELWFVASSTSTSCVNGLKKLKNFPCTQRAGKKLAP